VTAETCVGCSEQKITKEKSAILVEKLKIAVKFYIIWNITNKKINIVLSRYIVAWRVCVNVIFEKKNAFAFYS
jgi:hypothetical protein